MGSDHLPICMSYSNDKEFVTPNYKYNMKLADWNRFMNNVDLELRNTTAENNCTIITEQIIQGAESSIPKASAYIKGKLKNPWWTNECREALTKRNQALR